MDLLRPELPSPWAEFLSAVDHALPRPVVLHRLGGFVLAVQYGLPRPTQDVDYVEVLPSDEHLHERGFRVDETVVESDLNRFAELGLMLEEDGRNLSLALPEQTGDPV